VVDLRFESVICRPYPGTPAVAELPRTGSRRHWAQRPLRVPRRVAPGQNRVPGRRVRRICRPPSSSRRARRPWRAASLHRPLPPYDTAGLRAGSRTREGQRSGPAMPRAYDRV